jgi:hypothetical protein
MQKNIMMPTVVRRIQDLNRKIIVAGDITVIAGNGGNII